MYQLSKSLFKKYLQCPREFWLAHHHPEKMTGVTPPEAIFRGRQGYEFEQLVKKYLTAKKDLDYVFQKSVFTERLIARFDAFVENAGDGGSHIYEVKSSKYRAPGTNNDTLRKNMFDLGFQVFAARELGMEISKAFLINVDGDYVLGDALDLEGLIKISDVTDEINALQPVIAENIDWAFELLKGEPSVAFENFCDLKLDCPYFRWKYPELPQRTVCDIPRINADNVSKLIAEGCFAIEDIPEDFVLPAAQSEMVEFIKAGETVMDLEGISDRLAELEYPLYFLDFETVNPSIPQIKGMKPLDQIIFQHSLHVLKTPESEHEHFEFLSNGEGEAPREVAASLKDLIGDTGSVLVWYKSFEMGRNREMGELYPEYADFFESVNGRVFDLYEIFSKKLYRDPRFLNNSIKSILPILAPELSYKELAIGNGGLASARWFDEVFKGEDPVKKTRTMKNLREYCHLDTLAMVRIFEVLEAL